jgi:hypothetical protein
MKQLLVLITLSGVLFISSVALAQSDNQTSEENTQKEKELVKADTNENKPKERSIWSEIGSSAKSLTDSTLEKADQLSTGVGNIYDDAVTLSKDSLNGFLSEMDESVILMEQLGYDITDVYMGVGIIPDLSFKVARKRALSKEQQAEILKEQKVGVVMDYILNKLNEAYDMKVKGYHIKDVKIRVALSPGATVHFVKNLEE